MMKLSKIEKIGQPPIFPDNDVETYFIPSLSPKKNNFKNPNNAEVLKAEIPITPIAPKLELDEGLSFMCEPIYKPSFFFSKKSESNEEQNENYSYNGNNEVEESEKRNQNNIESKLSLIKSKSNDSLAVRKKQLTEKRSKKHETVLRNSIKDLRNCYDDSSSKTRIKKKKSKKTMKKSSSSLFSSSTPSSSSTTVSRNSMLGLNRNELKNGNRSLRSPSDKKVVIKKPINYLRSNSKSNLNTKSRYMLLSSNSSNSVKVRKDKSSSGDSKLNKKKGKMNVSLPLSISIPYSSSKKGGRTSSKSQKVKSSSSTIERKNASIKGKSEGRKIKLPLNISLSVTTSNINDSNDEENENSSSNSVVEEGFDSSYCNNNFNNCNTNNITTDPQYCNPDNENENDESNKKNYIIENIIVNNENEKIFSPKTMYATYNNDYPEETSDNQNSEYEQELLKRDFFSNMARNKMNYSSSETDKMYYYEINEDQKENINSNQIIQINNNNNSNKNINIENNENNNINKRLLNKSINNIIQKSKKILLKKTGKNVETWSTKSEPIDYSENENRKSTTNKKTLIKNSQKVTNIMNNNLIYNNDEYNIAYDMPPDYSMIPCSPPRSEHLLPSAPSSIYNEKYVAKQNVTDVIMKESQNERNIVNIKSLCTNNINETKNMKNTLDNTSSPNNNNDENKGYNSNDYYNNNDTNFNNSSIPYDLRESFRNEINENQQLLPQQPMIKYNNNYYKSNDIQNLQAAHLSLNTKNLTPLYHGEYMDNKYSVNYFTDLNYNMYQYNDNYNNKYQNNNGYNTTNDNNNKVNNSNYIIDINNTDISSKNKNKSKKNQHYNRHMMLLNNYEPIPSDSNNDNGIKSFKNESNYLEYKRNYITSKSSYLLYSAGQDEHLVKLKIPKLDPKISYIPDASSIRYNHPDLEKVRDVYDYFKNDHQAIEEPTNDNEFFQQMLNAIKKPKFSVTIVGYHPTSKLNLNYYNDISMGENWKMECTHMSRFKTPTFKIQINMENIVNEQWTELCVDNIYSYATEIPTFNKIIDNYVKSRKPIKKIELMTKVIFENRMEFESEIQKMFLSVGYYDKIEFIYHTSKSGVKIEKGKNFQEFNDNLCWTLCIWMYMWWIIWYPIMWCISGTELPPMIAYYQARIDMNLLRCIQPLILEGASQKDLFVVTI